MRAARERERDFSTSIEMQLTGLAIDPETRSYADNLLDEFWMSRRSRILQRIKGRDQKTKREVIIGSGFHAAVYAAMRVAAGFPKPIVVDQAKHVGGVFAMTQRPVFYLNSSNRPGGPGLVSDLAAQPNYLPGAPVQPANLSAADFQTNADMAWVIRATLAQCAEVIPNFAVTDLNNDIYGERTTLSGPNGVEILAPRVIDARGIGQPRDLKSANGKTVLTFPDFMQLMDRPWPLRGIQRVAVLGDGDAGRVAVEQLLGIGPQGNMSMALDRVEYIDWYGESLPTDPRQWRERETTRYLQIAKFLKDGRVGTRQVRIFRRKASAVALPNQGIVQGRTYDLVVLATGWGEFAEPSRLYYLDDMRRYSLKDDLVVAQYSRDSKVYRVGPQAKLPFSVAEETDALSNKANRISMSRLGPKTAALAASLPAPSAIGRGERLTS
jgi:hypothetical protein